MTCLKLVPFLLLSKIEALKLSYADLDLRNIVWKILPSTQKNKEKTMTCLKLLLPLLLQKFKFWKLFLVWSKKLYKLWQKNWKCKLWRVCLKLGRVGKPFQKLKFLKVVQGCRLFLYPSRVLRGNIQKIPKLIPKNIFWSYAFWRLFELVLNLIF